MEFTLLYCIVGCWFLLKSINALMPALMLLSQV